MVFQIDHYRMSIPGQCIRIDDRERRSVGGKFKFTGAMLTSSNPKVCCRDAPFSDKETTATFSQPIMTITLYCASSIANEPFPIHVNDHLTVGEMKEVIKQKLSPDLNDLAANRLILWKVCPSLAYFTPSLSSSSSDFVLSA